MILCHCVMYYVYSAKDCNWTQSTNFAKIAILKLRTIITVCLCVGLFGYRKPSSC